MKTDEKSIRSSEPAFRYAVAAGALKHPAKNCPPSPRQLCSVHTLFVFEIATLACPSLSTPCCQDPICVICLVLVV